MFVSERKKSLKLTIITPLASLVVFTAFFVGVLVYRYLDQQRIEEAISHAELIAYAIQYTAEIAGGSPELNRMVQALGTEKGVSLIKVVSLESGRIVAANRFGWRGKRLDAVKESPVHNTILQQVSTQSNSDVALLQKDNVTVTYVSVFPVASQSRQGMLDSAAVIVDLNTSAALIEIRKTLLVFTLTLGLTAAMCVISIYFLLARYVYRPIDNIASVISRRAAGDKTSYAKVYREDEIGTLVNAFNEFTDIEEENKRKLQERENELELIFNSVPVKIWYKDDKNNIVRLNQSAADSMGMQLAEIEGKNTFELFPSMAEEYLKDDLEVIRSGKPKLNIIEKYTPVNADHGWVKTDKVPYNFEQGKKGVLVVAQDISALKRVEESLRQSEQRFQLVIEATRDGIWDWPNMDKDEQYWSPQWKALVGYREDEIEAKFSTFTSMMHPEDLAIFEEALGVHVEQGKAFDVEYRLKTKDDAYKWFRAKGLVSIDIESGNKRMTGSITDIQNQKDSENKLKKYTAELERSNKELDEFAYVASHDLKSPLRGIDQLATWIGEDVAEGRYDELGENLALMRGRVKRMERLLIDLLAYSRVGRGKEKVTEVNVGALAKEMFDLSSPPMEFQLQLVGDLPIFETITAPFEQVLRNLISNAIKHHNEKNGNICISCDETKYDTLYEFAVKDDGRRDR